MKNCPQCHTEMDDEAVFCGECGAEYVLPQDEEVVSNYCDQCGQQLEEDIQFCPNCGAPVNSPEPVINPPKRKGKRIWIWSGIALAVIAAVVGVFLLLNAPKSDYVAYIKDGELWYHKFGGDMLELTSDMVAVDDITDDYFSRLNGRNVSAMFQLTSDGKTLFYPDKIDENGMNVYCRDISDTKAAPVKIGAGITTFFINDEGDRIIYQKDSGVYMGPMDNVRKICGDNCQLVAIDKNFNAAIYCEIERHTMETGAMEDYVEYTYYLWKDGEKEKLVNGKISDFFVMGDAADCKANQILRNYGVYYGEITSGAKLVYETLSDVCYLKEDVLNIRYADGTINKIDSEVESVEAVSKTGDIYYTKSPEQILYVDYIEDETLMESQMERSYSTTYTLYGYIGGKTEKILKDYNYVRIVGDSSAAVVRYYDLASVKKVKISEAGDFGTARTQLREKISDSVRYAVLIDGTLHELDVKNVSNWAISHETMKLYFLCVDKVREKDANGNLTENTVYADEGELYCVSIGEGGVEAPKLYDSDVFWVCGIQLTKTGEPIYFKDYKHEKKRATLFVSGKEIDHDVYPNWVSYLDNGSYLYYIDYNSDADKQSGTLRMYRNGKPTTIADDVHTAVVTPENEILYLKDYDMENYKGILCRYYNGKNEQIDEDVTALLDVYVHKQ